MTRHKPRPQPTSDALRCQHRSAANRRCRLLRSDTHPALCYFHARKTQLAADRERVIADLTSLSGGFQTANDVNHVLGNLFALLAERRIPPRDAAILAYIGQLLLQTLKGVKWEIQQARGCDAFEAILRAALVQKLPAPQQR